MICGKLCRISQHALILCYGGPVNHGVRQNFDWVEPKGSVSEIQGTPQVPDAAVLDIGRKSVFAVIGSPLRMRLFEIVRRVGECSVRELAIHSGLSATGLYYHLQALEHLELIRQVGVRKGDARRAPAVYAATCQRIRITFNPDDHTHRSRLSAVRRRWNDECMRSMDDALEVLRAGRSAQVMARLDWEHLTQSEIDQVHGLFAQVEQICNGARARGTLIPEDSKPVHLGLHLYELAETVLPSPLVTTEPARRSAPLGDLVQRIDTARERQRTAAV